MKNYLVVLCMLSVALFSANAQTSDNVFTSVPLVNGKIVFQQFVHAEQGMSEDQQYALLYKWGKDNFAGNPLLAGIRFDDKARAITVSSKVELLLPENRNGVREKMLMNYRFDASILNQGCMLIIRDISFQPVKDKTSGIFTKSVPAEQLITEAAINSSTGEVREKNHNLQKSTLYFLNQMHAELKSVFELKK